MLQLGVENLITIKNLTEKQDNYSNSSLKSEQKVYNITTNRILAVSAYLDYLSKSHTRAQPT